MCSDVPAKLECVLFFFFLNQKHNKNEMNIIWQYILKQIGAIQQDAKTWDVLLLTRNISLEYRGVRWWCEVVLLWQRIEDMWTDIPLKV